MRSPTAPAPRLFAAILALTGLLAGQAAPAASAKEIDIKVDAALERFRQ